MNEPRVEVVKRCVFCGNESRLTVDAARYERWQAGEHIQNAFPEMPAEIREVLISGTHPACWDKYMEEED